MRKHKIREAVLFVPQTGRKDLENLRARACVLPNRFSCVCGFLV